MYEHKKQPLAPTVIYRQRLCKNFIVVMAVLAISLCIGILGYKFTVPEFDWYDSLLNASMILSGMGPVVASNIVLTPAAKVFASCYALFSGITFIGTIGIIIAPIAHRFFHKMHIEDK
jgi:hypothetical protein